MKAQNKFVMIVAGLASTLILSACGSSFFAKTEEPATLEKIDKKKPGRVSTESVQRSEALVEEGEALVDISTLSEAYGKFSEALETDPGNQQALFWKSTLKVPLTFKGIFRRMKPYYSQTPQTAARYRDMDYQASQKIESYRFLTDGPEDIRSAEDFNDWIDQLRLSLEELRVTLKKLRNSELTIAIPNSVSQPILRAQSMYGCQEISFGPIRYQESEGCQKITKPTVGLNLIDFEAMLLAVGIYQSYLELWTAYYLNPDLLVGIDDLDPTDKPSVDQFLEFLFDVKNGGKLRREKPFSAIQDVGQEAIVGFRYILENQQKACPKGIASLENRSGYLLQVGACLEPQVNRENDPRELMKAFESILAAQPAPIKIGREVRARVNFVSLFENPVADLNELRPFRLDACGRLIGFNDKPLQHAFMEGSANDLITLSNAKEGACK